MTFSTMGSVIGRAYWFTFANLWRIVLVGLPMSLVLLFITYVMTYTAPEFTQALAADFQAAGAAFNAQIFVFYALSFIPLMILLTGLYRAYFNRNAVLPYIWSGLLPFKTLWTGFLFTFFYALSFLLVFLVAVVVFGVMGWVLGMVEDVTVNEVLTLRDGSTPVTIATMIISGLFAVGAVLYLLRYWVRSSVFLPQTVYERSVRFKDAWAATKGQAWTLGLTYALGFASFILLTWIFFAAIKAGFSAMGNEPMVWLLTVAQGSLPAASPDRDFWDVLTAAAIVQFIALLFWAYVVGITGAAYDAVTGRLNAVSGE